MAKPSIPMAGPIQLPDVVVSTSSRPMMGPVQEKLTSVRVKAMRKMESSPLVSDALLSTLLVHDEGSVSSNHPKNERANTTRSAQKMRLNTAFVAKSLSVWAPKMAVTRSPRAR